MRVGWIEMLRIEWFDHPSIYASGRAAPVSEPDWRFELQDGNDRNIGLWPVRPAGLQPAASPTQSAWRVQYTISGVQLRWAHRLQVCVPRTGVFARDDGKKVAQRYFEPTSRAISSSTRQTLSTRILCPAAFG